METRRQQPALSYCLNIHPGETWAEMVGAVNTAAAAVRALVEPAGRLAVGLRISATAANEANAERIARLRAALEAAGLVVTSVNAFPYGRFHRARVKDAVYRPDWRTPEREAYTRQVAEILAALLPEGGAGCVSTVPVGYRFDTWLEVDIAEARTRLRRAVEALEALYQRTGRRVGLALEPEPDCVVETTAELTAFLESMALPERLAPYLGACVDICHLAVLGESPVEALCCLRGAGVPVHKIQLSAAVKARCSERGLRALAALADDVYLHQTCAFDADGRLVARWRDLPEALALLRERTDVAEVRAHVHVPLHWPGEGDLTTTAPSSGDGFWREAAAVTREIEIETYTFDVLPAPLRAQGVIGSIAAEYRWARASLQAAVGAMG